MRRAHTIEEVLEASALGKDTKFQFTYQPELLFVISRELSRQYLNCTPTTPYYGYDIWNAYEFSWLNNKGKPTVCVAEFIIPCSSEYLLESKHFKLYLNSFTNTAFDSADSVYQTLKNDLSTAVKSDVTVNLLSLDDLNKTKLHTYQGYCLDQLDVEISEYHPNSNLLTTNSKKVEETLYSDLLKSNCLVTGQPDWASVQIQYQGAQINRENLLKYIISSRDHHEMHEQCIERIFFDIQQQCKPKQLTVAARYTRRGGIDINPIRATHPISNILNNRHIRQ